MQYIDDKIKEYIFPSSISACGGDIGNINSLLTEKTLQIGLNETDLTFINGESFVVLDFKREIHGGLRILTHFLSNAPSVRIRFGESLSESCSELGVNNSGNAHSKRDITSPLIELCDNEFGQTGFRFARIDFLNKDAKASIKSIVAFSQYRNLSQIGTFECNDSAVNDIFSVAAYTIKLNMNEMIWDGIKRDRLVWIGDIHPEMKSIFCLYGKDKCIKNSLDFVKKETPLPLWMNNIPMYSMWWIIILKDYFVNTADCEYIKLQTDYLIGLLKQINGCVKSDGELDFPYYFIDWSTHDKDDEHAGVSALTALAMTAAKYILNALAINTDICDEILAKLSKKSYTISNAKQCCALNILAGNVNNDFSELLSSDGAKGLSTFMSYYIFSALSKIGKEQVAFDTMKEYYGGMLKMGATTFWEDFSMDWMTNSCRIDELPLAGQNDIHRDFGDYCYKGFRHSLCHGWSSGCIPFLVETVLGIKIVEAGCKVVSIKPNLCGLTFAKGSFPTPYGLISVEHTLKEGKITTNYSAPKDIKIICD